jgi:hypothetical protein
MVKFSLPEFVDEAEVKHPGIAEEYSALRSLTGVLFPRRESDDFKHTLLLQSAIVWQHYNAILLLLSRGFGVQSLVLCRTLFELVVGALYLLKNPASLADFTDYGKLVFYEHCLAIKLPSHELVKIAPECEAIRSRLRAKRRTAWHGSTLKKVALGIGLGETYDLFYGDASSAAHADATKTLSYGSRGWKQSLRAFQDEKQADLVRYQSFWLTGYLLVRVTEGLDLGCNAEAKSLWQLMNKRAKDAAMPN